MLRCMAGVRRGIQLRIGMYEAQTRGVGCKRIRTVLTESSRTLDEEGCPVDESSS